MAAPKSFGSTTAGWRRLVTAEDPYHVHKTLGLACVASFAWRSCMIGPDDDMGFARYPHLTVPTLLLHLLLNLSSFVFAIPSQRIKTGGYRIWPEYRWHSLIFLSRSLVYLFMVWLVQQYPQVQDPPADDDAFAFFWRRALHTFVWDRHGWNWLLVLASSGAATLASQSQGPYRSQTIRDLEVPAAVQYYFSVAQILATTACLWGLPHRYTTHFIFCGILQGNAFLMTLRRKNVGSHGGLVFGYFLMIVLGMVACNTDNVHRAKYQYEYLGMALVGHTAILLRTSPRWTNTTAFHNQKHAQTTRTTLVEAVLALPWHCLSLLQNNKFVLWTAMYVLAEYVARPLVRDMEEASRNDTVPLETAWFLPTDTQPRDIRRGLYVFYALSVMAMVGIGVTKQAREWNWMTTTTTAPTNPERSVSTSHRKEQ